MPVAKGPTADDVGNTPGTAAMDYGSAKDEPGTDRDAVNMEHRGTVVSEDLSDFKVKSDSHDGQILRVDRKLVVEASVNGGTFKKHDAVIFTASSDPKKVLSLRKSSGDGESTATGRSEAGAGSNQDSGLKAD